ncbi:MAG TPA: hypothetical protein VHG92_02865, partial [Afifellaceae bacterium]|nr:hypothetical protein [Afifellaceae bacterium]
RVEVALRAQRQAALERPELRRAADAGFVLAPSSGATSPPVRDSAPEVKAAIAAFLAKGRS